MAFDIQAFFSEGWSVDKVKLKFILPTLKEVDLISYALSIDSRVKSNWVTNAIKQCHYNYNLEVSNSVTFYIGIGDNSLKGDFQEKQKSLVVEYNPNKLNPFKEFNYLRNLVSIPLHRRKIIYFDLAYDMYLKISDIKYTKRRVNEYHCVISHSELETIYLRSLGKNGSVRIYNKTLEQNGGVDEDIDYESGEVKTVRYDYYGDLTRYEIRIRPEKENFNLLKKVPFTFCELCKLHKLEVYYPSENEKIINLIKSYDTRTSQMLMLIHLGHSDLISRKNIKKYRDLYYNVKEKALNGSIFSTNSLDNFTVDKAFECFCNYIDSIVIDKKDFESFISEI